MTHVDRSSRAPSIAGIVLLAIGAGCLATSASLPHGEPATAEWLTIQPGGDTSCAFDTPFEFWVREADPSRLLLYLQGGGGCWDFESCHPDRRIQFISRIDTTSYAQRSQGIFDGSAPENPFRDHTAVFVPYCTGDFHLGGRRVTHLAPADDEADSVTVNHAGYANLAAVLEYLSSRPSPPGRITVIGGSAGAVASPVVAAEVAALFPDAEVRQVGDGVAGLRLEAARAILALWGADSVLAARGLPVRPDGDAFAALYRAAAERQPGIRFSQVATTEDWRISEALALFGADPADLPALIATTYDEIRAAGICFTGYAIPGEEHTILWRPEFFAARVGREPLSSVLAREVLDAPCPEERPSAPGPVRPPASP